MEIVVLSAIEVALTVCLVEVKRIAWLELCKYIEKTQDPNFIHTKNPKSMSPPIE